MTKSEEKYLEMEFSSENDKYKEYEEALEKGLQEALKLV